MKAGEPDLRQACAWLDEIGRGSETAIRRFYEAFAPRVHAYVLRQLGDPGRAGEVVVDTFYEVWRHPGRFNGESKVTTWLIGIARNKILHVLRARRPGDEEIDEEMAADEPGPFELVALREQRDAIFAAIDRLPAEQRECLLLVLVDGLSIQEVAGLQGCPENTVKTRLFHARQKLKRALAPDSEAVGSS